MNADNDNRVFIFDTTLRDGEQAPGCSMTPREKLRVAKALRDLKVDIIEAGLPAASAGDFESVQTIAQTIQGPIICGLARCNPKDIVRAWDAVKDAQHSRIHIFVATSEIHREHKLQMAKEEILKSAVESVVEAAQNARRALLGGVTTVRDCADVFGVTLTLKQAIDAGNLDGPRILACGLPITTTAGHLNYMGISSDSTEEVLKAVRTVVNMGVDWVKVMATGGGLTPASNVRRAQYSAETLTALVQDAHRLGRKVAAHAHGTEGILNCAIAGTDSIEHCSWMAEEEGLRYDENAIDLIRKKGLYVSHTIAGPRTGSPEEVKEILNSELGERFALLRRTLEEGVPMVISSDAGIPGCRFEDFAGSLVIAVKCCGFSPMGSISDSTSRSSKIL